MILAYANPDPDNFRFELLVAVAMDSSNWSCSNSGHRGSRGSRGGVQGGLPLTAAHRPSLDTEYYALIDSTVLIQYSKGLTVVH